MGRACSTCSRVIHKGFEIWEKRGFRRCQDRLTTSGPRERTDPISNRFLPAPREIAFECKSPVKKHPVNNLLIVKKGRCGGF